MKLIKNNLIWGFISTCLALMLLVSFVLAKEKQRLPLIIAEAGVDKELAAIGDKIRYTIKVKANKDIEVEFPSFGENLAGFAIKDFGSKKSGLFGKKTYVHWYVLDTYVTGEYTIPKAVVKYKKRGEELWQKAETNEVKIKVQSLLEDTGAASDIKDIKGPVSFPDRLKYYLISGFFILIVIIGFTLRSLARRKDISVVIPPRPAHEIAFEALKKLKEKDYIREDKIKEYYIELSDIVRHYLENRFDIRAPQMSTEEFLIKAKEAGELKYEHKNLLKDFLLHCDLVKFAKYQPLKEEIEKSYSSAERLIEQTRQEKVAQDSK
jgi:hypothetical protein